MSVATMLTESMQLHLLAKEARRTKAANARGLLVQARDLRVQAHEADPQHSDPAWAAEQDKSPKGRDTHVEFTLFYAQQLGTE